MHLSPTNPCLNLWKIGSNYVLSIYLVHTKFTSLTMVISCHCTFHRYFQLCRIFILFNLWEFVFFFACFFFCVSFHTIFSGWPHLVHRQFLHISFRVCNRSIWAMNRICLPCWYSNILQNHYGRIFGTLGMWIVRNTALSRTAHDGHCSKRITIEENDNIWVNKHKISIIIECLKSFFFFSIAPNEERHEQVEFCSVRFC